MEKLTVELEKVMRERFGKDSLIALATSENNIPHVREVDGFYENGSFYVITYATSNKMVQINENPTIAISGEWFTAHGEGINLGYFRKTDNEAIAEKLKTAFAVWIDNGHNDFEDENTIILQIKLHDGVLFANGNRYEIDFTEENA